MCLFLQTTLSASLPIHAPSTPPPNCPTVSLYPPPPHHTHTPNHSTAPCLTLPERERERERERARGRQCIFSSGCFFFFHSSLLPPPPCGNDDLVITGAKYITAVAWLPRCVDSKRFKWLFRSLLAVKSADDGKRPSAPLRLRGQRMGLLYETEVPCITEAPASPPPSPAPVGRGGGPRAGPREPLERGRRLICEFGLYEVTRLRRAVQRKQLSWQNGECSSA